jgi:hypothetical protein
MAGRDEATVLVVGQPTRYSPLHTTCNTLDLGATLPVGSVLRGLVVKQRS